MSDAAATRPAGGRRDAAAYAFLAVLVLGAGLRAVRLFHDGFEPDEWFEVYARTMVLDHWVPRMPSGVVWLYGGILLPVGALGTWIGGTDVFWNRLPLCLLSIGTLWLVARTARRLWGPWAGVAAAAALAIHPGHVEFSANVKCYGALTLATAWAADRWAAWTIERDDRAARTFGVAYLPAALIHPCAAFLLPGLVVAGALGRGLRWLVMPRTLLTFAACVLPLAVFGWAIATFDEGLVPSLASSSTAQGLGSLVRERLRRLLPALGSHGWHSTWHAALFWTALAGAAWGAVAAVRRRESLAASSAGRAALLFVVWLGTIGTITMLSRHIGDLYVLDASPFLALAAAGSLAAFAALVRRPVVVAAVSAGLVAAHVGLSRCVWPEVFGPRTAYAALLARYGTAQEGDLSLGGGPHAALSSGGRVRDFLVYGGPPTVAEFVRDGRRYDRIFGRPLLGTVADLRPVFDAAPRAFYLVSDKELALGRVTPEVHAWLTARMRLVATSPGKPAFSLYVKP